MSKDDGWPIALTKCYFCGEDGTIVISRIPHNSKVAEMQGKVIDMTPCSKCEGYMNQGIILISIDNSKSDPGWEKEKVPNPYRTGGFWVVTEESIKRVLNEKRLVDYAIKMRWMFVEHEVCVRLGLFAATETNEGGKQDEEKKDDIPSV